MSTQTGNQGRDIQSAYRKHERRWKENRYVYPVVSRRSGGVSVGINLNPGRECSFNCVYCQVDRRNPVLFRIMSSDRLEAELDAILKDERSGLLYEAYPFNLLPEEGRGVRDIAFSGDGEPTGVPAFGEAVGIAVRVRKRFGLTGAKIVLITNASCLDKPSVRQALAVMDENNGEIWAKLDAGTEEYFRKINRTVIPMGRILDNILEAARERPLVIQSLWMRIDNAAPPAAEIQAYCARLNELLASGGLLRGLHLHTIARSPAEKFVSPLSNEELDRIAATVRENVPIPVDVFYGVRI